MGRNIRFSACTDMHSAIEKLDIALGNAKAKVADVPPRISSAPPSTPETSSLSLRGWIQRLDVVLDARDVPPEAKLRNWSAVMSAVTINTTQAIIRSGTPNWRRKQRESRRK